MSNDDNSQSQESWAAIIGLDWGHKEHTWCLRPVLGAEETGVTSARSNQLHAWLGGLQARFQGRPVGLALEAPCPELVAALRAYSWLRIYPVHAATSARFRRAFRPSGAKDDPPDSRTLADLLGGHRDKLRPLSPSAATNTRQLDAYNKLRRQLIDQRTQASLRLREALRCSFPQALELLPGELWRPMALEFLKRWPDLESARRARRGSLKKFYFEHGCRSESLIEERLQILAQARALHEDEVLLEILRQKILHARQLIALLNRQLDRILKNIERLFRQHEKAQLVRNLPGAGPAMAPRLLCALELTGELDASSLQRYAGVAPVIEKSGDRKWVHRRWNPPRFLHQSLIEWAGLTVQYSRWAQAYYQRAQTAGKGRYTILRALAFKWLRILVRCWKNDEFYDEERYIRTLIERGSPGAADLLPRPTPRSPKS